jgi:hypothetical protein
MRPDDAEHIVRCVNAHDELVAALEQIAQADHPDYPHFTRGTEAEFAMHLMGIARAALARALSL